MNKKILFSGISILASLSIAVGGAFAAFSSVNTNAGNTFGAGTLVLSINTQTVTSTGVFGVTNAAPGQSFSQKLTLKNEGSVNASSVAVSSIAISGTNPELAGDVTLLLFNDVNDNGVFDAGDVSLGSGHLNDPSWVGFTLAGITLPAGGTYHLGGQVTLDLGAPNTDQGKSMSFNLALQANQ